jgi:hypothetical protein
MSKTGVRAGRNLDYFFPVGKDRLAAKGQSLDSQKLCDPVDVGERDINRDSVFEQVGYQGRQGQWA